MAEGNREVLIKCYKCGKSYTTDMMRYDPDRPARLICRGCLTKGNPKAAGGSKETVSASAPVGDVKYYCIKCHYKFSRKRNMTVSHCPYCGSDTLTTKTDASSILKRAEDEEFDY